jgi:hypothetical protein
MSDGAFLVVPLSKNTYSNKKKQKLIQEPHRKLLKRESVQSDWLTPWIETISLLVGVVFSEAIN